MNPSILRRLFSGPRFRSDPEGGFTLVEMIMGITVMGIIMVPLAMAIAVGFRATLHTQERLEAAQDAQAVSAYFPPDVQSVDASGFNPTDSVNEDVCPADPTATGDRVETPLALFVWNQDLGVNGQSVARYIARGQGRTSELVRRFCKTTSDAPVDSVLARNFGEGTTTEAKQYFTDPGAVNPARNETPMCGTRTCTLLIHGTFDYRLEADRRVKGTTSDATIPGAPTNVHTTGGNQRATIYWDTPVDDGGAPIEEYYIQNVQTQAITGPYTTPDGTPPGAGQPGALGVTITGLTNGQGYTFKVRAKNVLGPGSFSEPSSVVTPGPTVADPPTVGVATADPVVAGKASLTWSLPPGYNDGGAPGTGYRIYAQNAPTPALTADVPAGAMSGVITGLSNNTPYTLSVTALNSRGESSPSAGSNQILTLPGKPGTPAASSSGTLGTVVLTFTPPSGGAIGTLTNFRAHIVQPNTYTAPTSAATACPTAGTCTLTVPGVAAGQTVTVQAQNATGWGVESDAATGIDVNPPVVTLTAPAANASLGATETFAGGAGTTAGDLPAVTVRVYSGTTATGSVVQTRTANGSSGSWSVDASPSLPDGQYTAQATQTDSFGNVGVSGTRTFWVDSSPPPVVITSPSADQVISNNSSPVAVTFSGTAGNAVGPHPTADSAQITVKLYTGASATGTPAQTLTATRSGTSTSWSVAASPALTYNTYTVQATQNDLAGNVGTATRTFQVAPKHVRVATPVNGGSATGDGTAANPMDTVAHGIAKAVSLGWTQVDVAQGTYNEGLTGVALVDNVSISGGWTQDFSAQSGANTSTVIQGGQQAALSDGDTGVTLSRLMLSGLGASTVDRNVYGLRAVNTSNVTLTNVRVTAATGFAGAQGAAGSDGANGDVGNDGANGANGNSNGPSGGNGGSGGPASDGGKGGAGGKFNADGSAGVTVSGGGTRGAGGPKGGSGCQSGSNGGSANDGGTPSAGSSGSGGTGGVSGLTAGSPNALWAGSSGGGAGDGGNGTGGGGGGGGGGSSSSCSSSQRSSGGSGGGGGEGGTAGTGGPGGTYGGGSFGVYTYNSFVTLDSISSVATGAGGAGGAGGLAGNGGNGGAGGNGGNGGTRGGDGGAGGDGGIGSDGGRGGGSAGGPSVALFDRGTGSITQNSASLSVGSGGAGGAGGSTGGAGVSQNTAAV